MIICVCRRLNTAAVQNALDAGARTPDCVQAHHGNEFNCGRCRAAIDDMIDAHAPERRAASFGPLEPLASAAE